MKKVALPTQVYASSFSSLQDSSHVTPPIGGIYSGKFKKVFQFLWMALLLPCVGWAQGFSISGNQLRDANGNNFIMKGINVPTAWFTTDVNNNIANIRNRTNANTLRIVVTTSTPDAAWQTSVANCIANKMIPMVELHDVTGSNSTSELQRMANFWASKASYLTRSDISKYILINIANEWGDWFMSSPTNAPDGTVWRDAYINAVKTLRNAGINTTIVVDAPGYGQDNKVNTLLSYAPAVQSGDPRHNVLFSIHMYCEWAINGNSTVTTHLPAVKNAGIPVIVGEFGFQHTEGSGTCDINESQIMSTCQSNGIGWLAWSWKGNGSGVEYLDLSNDWGGTSLTGWGNTVVNGANGTKTSATASVFSSSCTPTTIVPYTQVNGGTWQQTSAATLPAGGTVTFGPQPVTGGSWSWTGPNGFTASTREITRTNIQSAQTGTYTARYTNASGCQSTRAFTITIGSGRMAVEEATQAQQNTWVVYPNPSAKEFTLERSGTFSYFIHDISGKRLENGQGTDKATIGGALAAGLYVLQVQSPQGIKVFKLIKN